MGGFSSIGGQGLKAGFQALKSGIGAKAAAQAGKAAAKKEAGSIASGLSGKGFTQSAAKAASGPAEAGAGVRPGSGGDGAAAPKRVMDGGRPDRETVFAGHGQHNLSDGNVTVPEGTSVAVYARYGSALSDSDGFAVESGRSRMTPVRIYAAGESMPNYTLLPPGGLTIRSESVTVSKSTQLSELLQPDMGACHWAACGGIS